MCVIMCVCVCMHVCMQAGMDVFIYFRVAHIQAVEPTATQFFSVSPAENQFDTIARN